MADSWVNSAERIGADLHLELSGSGGRRAALIRALREAVRGGRLAPGTRLPPYRSLAADLGVARNTVADAYAELVAEGWLTARQGSGRRKTPIRVLEAGRTVGRPRARTQKGTSTRAWTPARSTAGHAGRVVVPARRLARVVPPGPPAGTHRGLRAR